MAKIKKACKACGKGFEVNPSQSRRRYCNKVCRNSDYNSFRKAPLRDVSVEGEIATVCLSRGARAIVDAADRSAIEGRHWHINVGYAATNVRIGRGSDGRSRYQMVFLHHVIAGVPLGEFVIDHINGDRLDNRRSNLRICTRAENNRNVRATAKTSRFKGVYSIKPGHFYVYIFANKIKTWLGSHRDEERAASVYDMKAIQLHGDFAWLNFPEQSPLWFVYLYCLPGGSLRTWFVDRISNLKYA